MRQRILCIWIQFERGNSAPIDHVIAACEAMRELAYEVHSLKVDIDAPLKRRIVGKRGPSWRVPHAEYQRVLRDIDASLHTFIRVSCGTKSLKNSFHLEAWSVCFTDGNMVGSKRSELLMCLRPDLLVKQRDAVERLIGICDAAIGSASIVSGVCEYCAWSEVFGGNYFDAGPWSGFPRWRAMRRQMWNEGAARGHWVRDVGWITLVGRSLSERATDWPETCRLYQAFGDGVAMIQQQSVAQRPYGTAFVAAQNPEHYWEEPIEEVSRLNGWLAMRLRMDNLIM